jgi:hypothetical protein
LCNPDWVKNKKDLNRDKYFKYFDKRGSYKIKFKNVNKKKTVIVREGYYFHEFLKVSLADLITLLSSSV